MILLPNNNFGVAIMLLLMALSAIVPFVVALWLMLYIAPWWIAVSVAIAVGVISLAKSVKLKEVVE